MTSALSELVYDLQFPQNEFYCDSIQFENRKLNNQICSVKELQMKHFITSILLMISLSCFSQLESYSSQSITDLPLIEEVDQSEINEFHLFDVGFDWMLDTKTEVINGIWYSPTIEFNLNRPNGFIFQFQTGALPTLKGYKLDKAQPSAGVSIGYSF